MDYTDEMLRGTYPDIGGLERRTPHVGDRVEYRAAPGEIPPGELGTVRGVAPDFGPLWVQFDNGEYVSMHAQRFSPLTERGCGVIKTDGIDRGPGNVPVFTFTVSVPDGTPWDHPRVLTPYQVSAVLNRAAGEVMRFGERHVREAFELHRVHPGGAVTSYAFWEGGEPWTWDREGYERPGSPGGAYRPWATS